MYIELIRINGTLNHHLTQAIGRSNKHYLIKAGFRIQREHHTRCGQIGTHHALYTGRNGDALMVISLMHPVRDGPIIKQRSKNVLDSEHHGINTLYIQEGFLLTGKRGVRHIFRCGRGAYRERSIGLTIRQFGICITDSLFQLRLKRGIDDPLADLLACFG